MLVRVCVERVVEPDDVAVKVWVLVRVSVDRVVDVEAEEADSEEAVTGDPGVLLVPEPVELSEELDGTTTVCVSVAVDVDVLPERDSDVVAVELELEAVCGVGRVVKMLMPVPPVLNEIEL